MADFPRIARRFFLASVNRLLASFHASIAMAYVVRFWQWYFVCGEIGVYDELSNGHFIATPTNFHNEGVLGGEPEYFVADVRCHGLLEMEWRQWHLRLENLVLF